MYPDFNKIIDHFDILGKFSKAIPCSSGHINDTYLIFTNNNQEPDYILQRINHHVFKNIPKLQENIQKGMGLFEIGEYDQARLVFEEALQLSPENKLARQYLEKSKIETVGKTVPLSPAAESRYLQGVDRFVKGKYGEAIAIWEEVLKEHPYNKKVLKALEGARERLNKSR